MRSTFIILLALHLSLAGSAWAKRPVWFSPEGQRAFTAAYKFAKRNHLPFFIKKHQRMKRIVVNVPSQLIHEWGKVFSREKGYIEPFFVTKEKRPPATLLRIGDISNKEYGKGEPYKKATRTGRVAFPIQLSREVLEKVEHEIHTRKNGVWDTMGGDPQDYGRNCTNWITEVIGHLTGYRGQDVLDNFKKMDRRPVKRSTVTVLMTNQVLEGFDRARYKSMVW